jgi:hypothetical protein
LTGSAFRENRVGLFAFFSWCLVTVVAVTILWPVNILLMALAYKVRLGYKPLDMEASDLWLRSALASFSLFLLTLLLLLATYGLIDGADLPPGPIQLALLMAYLPAGVGLVYWLFGLDDLLEALGIFLLYILMAGLPLLLIGRLTGLWGALGRQAPWLLFPS